MIYYLTILYICVYVNRSSISLVKTAASWHTHTQINNTWPNLAVQQHQNQNIILYFVLFHVCTKYRWFERVCSSMCVYAVCVSVTHSLSRGANPTFHVAAHMHGIFRSVWRQCLCVLYRLVYISSILFATFFRSCLLCSNLYYLCFFFYSPFISISELFSFCGFVYLQICLCIMYTCEHAVVREL